jgi:hypothetical protein
MVSSVFVQRLQHMLAVTGVVLIITPALLFFASLTGLLQLPDPLIAGESTEHSVARIAIVGCLLAALGTMKRA